jgi:hypothetical protein
VIFFAHARAETSNTRSKRNVGLLYGFLDSGSCSLAPRIFSSLSLKEFIFFLNSFQAGLGQLDRATAGSDSVTAGANPFVCKVNVRGLRKRGHVAHIVYDNTARSISLHNEGIRRRGHSGGGVKRHDAAATNEN